MQKNNSITVLFPSCTLQFPDYHWRQQNTLEIMSLLILRIMKEKRNLRKLQEVDKYIFSLLLEDVDTTIENAGDCSTHNRSLRRCDVEGKNRKK